jgi:hypothetical protein
MKSLLSTKTAGVILISSLSFLLVFHILVALRVIPIDKIWGGRVDEDSVISYQLTSITITIILLFVALIKAGYLKYAFLTKVVNIAIWFMVVYFGFMIFANLSAITTFEKIIFIPLSIILFISSLRLAIEKG